MKGERIYSYELDVGDVVDYGVGLDALLSGAQPVPPQGARFDVGFAGEIKGRLSGRVRGVDFARMRADGRIDLNIHATIETHDGCRIALEADGVAIPRPGEPALDLSENVRLTTAAPAYAWTNGRQIWATGEVDLGAGKIRIVAYMQ